MVTDYVVYDFRSAQLVGREAHLPPLFFYVEKLFRISLGPGCRKDQDTKCAVPAFVVFLIHLTSTVAVRCDRQGSRIQQRDVYMFYKIAIKQGSVILLV